MQVFALTVGAALLLALGAPASAQSDIKIGFVNVPFLLQNAPQTAVVDQRLTAEFAPRQAQLQEMDTALRAKAERYERDGAVMGAEEAAALRREIEQGERDLNRQAQIMQDDVNIRQEELLSSLQATIAQQIQRFAEAEDFDLILANAVYASEAIDITEEVLAALTAAADSND
jgi:outer membrane protein